MSKQQQATGLARASQSSARPLTSSCSSSSLSSLDERSARERHRPHRKRKHRSRDTNLPPHLPPPAPSDWDELRSHFQFVLPTDDYAEGEAAAEVNNAICQDRAYGSTWQQRMVKQYHSGLYKEYVLADLSRVTEPGNRVGLRWRVEQEVISGKGFRSCGNLMCGKPATASSSANPKSSAGSDRDDSAYRAAARRHMGIGVAENGGKNPIGILLPPPQEATASLDRYLQSCARERRKILQREQRKEQSGRHSKRAKRERNRHRRRRSEHCLKDRERAEQKRLSRLPPGTGLHDYEVDFAYAERGIKKRELVKVRLCLRCAPLLFLAKENAGGAMSSGGERGRKEVPAPAVRAREAREDAARNASVTGNTGNASFSDSTSGHDDDNPNDVSEISVAVKIEPHKTNNHGDRLG